MKRKKTMMIERIIQQSRDQLEDIEETIKQMTDPETLKKEEEVDQTVTETEKTQKWKIELVKLIKLKTWIMVWMRSIQIK